MSITIACEPHDDVMEDLKPLFHRHWEVFSVHGVTLDPNYELYKKTADLGHLLIYTVRDSGELVGYAFFFTSMNHHHRTLGWASSDIIWVEPKARRPRVASRLLDFVEADLARRGIAIAEIGTRPAFPALARLLEARGWSKVSIAFSKRL